MADTPNPLQNLTLKIRNLIVTFLNSTVGQIIIGAVVVVGVIALVIAGASLFGAILMLALIGIAIYFGSIRLLAGSALLATLLKLFPTSIKGMSTVLIPEKALTQLFAVVQAAGYIELILVVFFFFYLLSFGTSCINLRLFTVNTNVDNNTENNWPELLDDAKTIEHEPLKRKRA